MQKEECTFKISHTVSKVEKETVRDLLFPYWFINEQVKTKKFLNSYYIYNVMNGEWGGVFFGFGLTIIKVRGE